MGIDVRLDRRKQSEGGRLELSHERVVATDLEVNGSKGVDELRQLPTQPEHQLARGRVCRNIGPALACLG